MKFEKVLLAGATGYLGRYIAEQLLNNKYSTRLIVRNKQKAKFDSQFYEIEEGQVTQPQTIKGICSDVDVVISTIGITKQKDGLTYMDVDYQANKNLLEEAKNSGVKKFIYVSVLNGENLKNLNGCAAKEKFVEELKISGLDYCIIRPNGFFSDMTEILEMAKKGSVYLFSKGNFKMNPIHGEDLAEICVNSIESSKKEVQVGGPETITHNDIAHTAFRVLNKKPKITYIPNWIRITILRLVKTFTGSKVYGPIEFFMTVMAMDMIAPEYGKHTLERFFTELNKNN